MDPSTCHIVAEQVQDQSDIGELYKDSSPLPGVVAPNNLLRIGLTP